MGGFRWLETTDVVLVVFDNGTGEKFVTCKKMNTFLVWLQFIFTLIDHFDEVRLVFRVQDGVARLDVLVRFYTPPPQLSFRPDLFFLGGRGLGRRVTVTP